MQKSCQQQSRANINLCSCVNITPQQVEFDAAGARLPAPDPATLLPPTPAPAPAAPPAGGGKGGKGGRGKGNKAAKEAAAAAAAASKSAAAAGTGAGAGASGARGGSSSGGGGGAPGAVAVAAGTGQVPPPAMAPVLTADGFRRLCAAPPLQGANVRGWGVVIGWLWGDCFDARQRQKQTSDKLLLGASFLALCRALVVLVPSIPKSRAPTVVPIIPQATTQCPPH